MDAGGPGPNLDWNFGAAGPVTATPALWIANYPNPSASDAIYFGSQAAGATFVKLTNIYQATPTQAWFSPGTTAGLAGSAVSLSLDGSKVYALDQAGDLHCFAAATGGQCAGWAAMVYHGGSAVQSSSPWVSYSTGAIFFSDLGGILHKVDGSTGAGIWTFNLGAASRSSPVVLGGRIYVGNANGRFYRLRDPGTTPPAGFDVASFDLCGTSPCNSAIWQVANSATADVAGNALYVAAGGTVFEFPLDPAASWTPMAQQSLFTPADDTIFASPTFDVGGGSLYVAYFNALFRVPLPLGSHPLGTFLYQSASQHGLPLSSPLSYAGHVYVGDAQGYIEQYSCLTGNGGPDLVAIAGPYGDRIDSMPLVDYANGNIVFGYGSPTSTTGGVVQITQMGSWGCGSRSACSTAGCGGAGDCAQPMACVPDGTVPSAVWRSNGGGAGTASGQLETSIGSGVLAPGSVSTGGNTLTFGFIGDESF